jgi:hypothetical protein
MWKGQLALALLASLAIDMFPAAAVAQQRPELQAPSAFSDIADRAARSRALFSEAAKVITSPRCMNCHPAGDRLIRAMIGTSIGPWHCAVKPITGARAALRGVPHRGQFSSVRWRGELSKNPRSPALEFGSDRDGVGRKNAGRDMPSD